MGDRFRLADVLALVTRRFKQHMLKWVEPVTQKRRIVQSPLSADPALLNRISGEHGNHENNQCMSSGYAPVRSYLTGAAVPNSFHRP
jgi:hypothetical protein